jgi:hypothetical protein
MQRWPLLGAIDIPKGPPIAGRPAFLYGQALMMQDELIVLHCQFSSFAHRLIIRASTSHQGNCAMNIQPARSCEHLISGVAPHHYQSITRGCADAAMVPC